MHALSLVRGLAAFPDSTIGLGYTYLLSYELADGLPKRLMKVETPMPPMPPMPPIP